MFKRATIDTVREVNESVYELLETIDRCTDRLVERELTTPLPSLAHGADRPVTPGKPHGQINGAKRPLKETDDLDHHVRLERQYVSEGGMYQENTLVHSTCTVPVSQMSSTAGMKDGSLLPSLFCARSMFVHLSPPNPEDYVQQNWTMSDFADVLEDEQHEELSGDPEFDIHVEELFESHDLTIL